MGSVKNSVILIRFFEANIVLNFVGGQSLGRIHKSDGEQPPKRPKWLTTQFLTECLSNTRNGLVTVMLNAPQAFYLLG